MNYEDRRAFAPDYNHNPKSNNRHSNSKPAQVKAAAVEEATADAVPNLNSKPAQVTAAAVEEPIVEAPEQSIADAPAEKATADAVPKKEMPDVLAEEAIADEAAATFLAEVVEQIIKQEGTTKPAYTSTFSDLNPSDVPKKVAVQLEESGLESEGLRNAAPPPVRTWASFGAELLNILNLKFQQVKQWSYNNIGLPIYDAIFASRLAVHFSNNSQSKDRYDEVIQTIKDYVSLEKKIASNKSALKTCAEKIETRMNRLPTAERNWATQQQAVFSETTDVQLGAMFHEISNYRNIIVGTRALSESIAKISCDLNISGAYKEKMVKAYSYISAVKHLNAEALAAESMMVAKLGPQKGLIWGISTSVFDRNAPTEAELDSFERENPGLDIPAPISIDEFYMTISNQASPLERQKTLARERVILFSAAVCHEYARRLKLTAPD